jgi:uncharacterized protein (TIGR00297 family)
MTWVDIAVLALALAGCSILAYALRILDAKGAAASFFLGAIILAAGGLPWLLLMVAFTGIAFIATRFGRRRKEIFGTAEARDGQRGAPNVLANGAAPALAAVAAIAVAQTQTLALGMEAVTWAYVTAVAAITADTLASEIGGLSARTRLILPPFVTSKPGVNGAVSVAGQAAALLGPAAIAIAAVIMMNLDMRLIWIPILGGFLASQIDSILGATLEFDAVNADRPLSKGDVNFIASFIPMVVVLAAFALASL